MEACKDGEGLPLLFCQWLPLGVVLVQRVRLFQGHFRQYAKPGKLDVRLHALVDSDDANDVSKEGV